MAIQTSSISSSDPARAKWRNAALFLALLVAMLAGLNLLARHTERGSYIGKQRDKLIAAQDKAALVIGPSVAQHIVPQAMCIDAINLAEPRLDPFEVEALAGHMVDAGSIPQTWIYGVVPGFIGIDNGAEASLGSRRRIKTYRTLQSLDDWRLIGGDWKSAARAAALPALGYDEWRQRAQKVWADLANKAPSPPERKGPLSNQSLADYRANLDSARQRIRSHLAEAQRVNYYNDNGLGRAVQSLLRTQALLREHNAQLVMVYMPISPALHDELSSHHSAVLTTARSLQKRLEAAGAVVITDTQTHDIGSTVSNFRDAEHLTYNAGIAYSQDLARRLASQGLISQKDCPIF